MRQNVLFLFCMVLLLFATPVRAVDISGHEVVFDIQPSGTVKEEIHISFAGEVGESYFTYTVEGEISGLEVTDGKNKMHYNIDKTANGEKIRILVPNGTRDIFIQFFTNELVFWKENTMQFFTVIRFPEGLERAEITAILPEGFSVYNDMLYPESLLKTTDGRRIYLKWSIENPDDIPISIKIRNPYHSTDFLVFPVVAIFFASILWLFLWFRKRNAQVFLKGFTEDERKVVEILRERKVCYQNKLVRELGFSKAKVSRITKSLERKGLIQKEKSGKNRRIEWKG
ncbi:MAG: MarR family transcriptional regulator [Candidatus Aenigmatarchaeota archaeon]